MDINKNISFILYDHNPIRIAYFSGRALDKNTLTILQSKTEEEPALSLRISMHEMARLRNFLNDWYSSLHKLDKEHLDGWDK